MSAVTYLEDVPPNSGGFTIYPTSPQLLYPTSAQALNWVATERSSEVMDHIKRDIQPLEFTGRAGDTIFCHGWVVHSAGIHETNRIRFAAIQDFNKVRERSHMRWTAAGKNGGPRINCDMDGVFRFSEDSDDDPADGYREVTNQWIMDSNEHLDAWDVSHYDACMRTTLTIDDDIAAALKDRARNGGQSFKAVVNEVIRTGLTVGEKPVAGRAPFKVVSARRGFLPGIDPLKINQLVDELEVEDFLRKAHGRVGS